jgi:hypothetical protein
MKPPPSVSSLAAYPRSWRCLWSRSSC